MKPPNKITGEIAGGSRLFILRVFSAAYIAQFCLWGAMRLGCFLAMVCFVSGCVEVGPPAPYRPYSLIEAAKSADRIVITMLPSVTQDSPKAVDYCLTLTGSGMQRLIDALAGLERSANSSSRILDDSTNPEWRLEYCRGTNVLATAAFSRTVLFCDFMYGSPEVEFRSPRELRRLYRRVTKESSVDH